MNYKTIPDAARALGVHEGKVRRAVKSGSLASLKLGNRPLVDLDEAKAVLAEPEGVTIDVVSAETGLTVGAVRRAVREGWMPSRKPGKAYLFDLEAVREAIRQRVEEQTPKGKR